MALLLIAKSFFKIIIYILGDLHLFKHWSETFDMLMNSRFSMMLFAISCLIKFLAHPNLRFLDFEALCRTGVSNSNYQGGSKGRVWVRLSCIKYTTTKGSQVLKKTVKMIQSSQFLVITLSPKKFSASPSVFFSQKF